MNPLPSAPLIPDNSTPPPAWTGFAAAAATPPSAFCPPSSVITREQLAAHLTRPDAFRSLPDGRRLRLFSDALEFIEDDFGGYDPASRRSAHRVLWFATRTPEQLDALWLPESSAGEDGTPESDGLALHLRALQREIGAWARETFAPDTGREVRRLALTLWASVMSRMPVSGEKKNPPALTTVLPDSPSPTSAPCAGSSAAATPSATSAPAAPISSSSSTPSSVGPISTDSASSPPPKNPADSPPPAP